MKKSYKESWINTRMGFFSLLAILFWLKTILAYITAFNLGIESITQYLILLINPIATTIFILSIGLYVRNEKRAYATTLILYFLMTLLLFSNVVYYREFSDFITINTILGAGKVSSGLGQSALKLFSITDLIYLVDLFAIGGCLAAKKIKLDKQPVKGRFAFAVTSFSVLMFAVNLTLAEADRPQLLSRTFSKDHIVKYLGLNFFMAYDGVQTYQTNQIRAQASENDLVSVEEYVNKHHADKNPEMFGKAAGRNVIYIHLESLQQFMIDYKLTDKDGVEHEVTPFLNSLFHDQQTYSFDNVFHQVSAGKTSDAETLIENSLFGLTQGALFTQLGGKNTFQAAPDILSQTAGYTTAAFHGNVGSFWNRNDTYKNFGYEYFFDSSYYDVTDENSFQYGLHDKEFFDQSVQYLEHLQQPFYAKMLAVSNHYPYAKIQGSDDELPLPETADETINGYFATAHYADQAIEQFFNYLKATGLYDNSIIVLYGDHYGISNSRNPELAELLGKDKETWNEYDNAQLQRVPLMYHIPGETDGGISHTYGGQVDMLPTLLHLLGIDNSKYLMLGQDLFSKGHDQVVAFRNGDVMTPDYTIVGDNVYDNQTGALKTNISESEQQTIDGLKEKVQLQLATSDAINNGDLMRYYSTSGLQEIDTTTVNYRDQLQQLETIEKEKGKNSTSLYSKNGNKSTVDQYVRTDLVDEKTTESTESTEVSENK
ncbi:LTA synthase family protein [Vagococcus zengguangii]|uniref:LTA synthase family protein n=1 Tax=Vagococcus zengguangii TaxID=2571750 RepID=UPI003CCC4D39